MDETEKRLLDAVIADRWNDAPREVYADWLEERGDPRGKYLRLEMSSRRAIAELRELRSRIPADWQRTVARPRRDGISARSFDFTLSLTSARVPSFGGVVELMARAHGLVLRDDLDFQRDVRGARSIFAGDRSFEAPLTHLDVPGYVALLDAFGDLKGGDVDLEGISDTSDYGHVATLQGSLDDVAFRASVSFMCSGFSGRDARPLADLARHLLEGSQIEAPALTEGTREN